nr:unnamed protein product [Callosobruchus chinensis]
MQAAGILLNDVEKVVEEESSRQKRIWIKRRHTLEASANLLRELALEDPEEYIMCLRMTPDSFETLLNSIKLLIYKMDTLSTLSSTKSICVCLHWYSQQTSQ